MRKVMYIAINKDLNMSEGKIGAHTAHATFDYLLKMYYELDDEYSTWDEFATEFKNGGDTIIVVKASEKELLKWESEGFVSVRDRGCTEVEPNSLTAVNLGIYDKDKEVPKWIQRLRLL